MTPKILLRSTAPLALGIAVVLQTAPAMAFDTVNWTWTLSRTNTGTHTATSTLTAMPTGDMAVQARQIYLGDVHSESDSRATVLPAVSPLDGASDVGLVESNASSYANVYSAGSEVPLSVSIGQFHLGHVDPASGATPTVADPTATNPNYAYADAAISDLGSGFYTAHNTTATATAVDVMDAAAASEARAVSNTATFDVAAPPAEMVGMDPSGGYVTNALMSADLTQLSAGVVDARATTAVTMNSASNLGAFDGAIASATATAIGNLGSATVRVGTLPSAL